MELTTIELFNLLRNAIEYNDGQFLINMYAKQLTDRIYVSNNKEMTYEEMLESFGYKEIEKVKRR